MSADLMRRAATKMRERADAATPAPWEHGHEGLQGGEVIRGREHRVARVYKANWPTYAPDCENADHIASWDPAVAMVAAELLEAGAAEIDRRVARDGVEVLERVNPVFHAMTELARTYLHEEG